jgi:signal transduction histidine kinase/DNA-binding response OmpR family regulator
MTADFVTEAISDPHALNFLAGGGEMGALIRGFDWESSELGPPRAWPQSLKTAVRIMLTSRQPIWIGWGPQLIYLYNDPYKSIIGGKHPWALGRPTREVWREIWADIGPLLDTAMGGVEGTYVEEQLLIMERNGYPEETYYTFSYSPIPDDAGAPGGIICANTDDTARVIGERQLALLRELAAGTADARSWREACERSAQALSLDRHDLTFALVYMVEPDGEEALLAGAAGLAPGSPAAPDRLPLVGEAAWPVGEVYRSRQPLRIEDLEGRFGEALPTQPWDVASKSAVLLPIAASGETARAAVLVAGLNPYRLFDETYAGFLGLAAGQIAAAAASADAYAEARRRMEALAELDRAKTAFFSNVSHEFRTPLTLMLGPLEEVLSGEASAQEMRTQVELAHRSGARLLRLVNSLLDFSRIEAGRVQATFEPTELGAFSGEIASSFRSTIERAGLRLRVETPPLPGPVYLDREMWEKILLNLISNAFKFTFDGEIAVEVGPCPDGRAACVTVSDTGIGIAAKELPRLFERFHRIEGAQGRSFEGSGIGLALVHELVKLHAGDITAESAPGEGTTFVIRLPFGHAHLPADRVREDSGAGAPLRAHEFVDEALRWLPQVDQDASPATADLGDMTPERASLPGLGKQVLLADDNADMRGYVERLLAAQGYEVEAVADGEAALAAARQRRPHLVLSDVMMPRLDGFGLLKALRGDAATAAVPVLLLSARAGEEAKVEGLEAGADDYLVKPFAARELLARVNANIQLAELRNAAEQALREKQSVLEEEARALQVLNRAADAVLGDLDLERVVQTITDAGVEVSGAQFGAFFYNVINDAGESYTLYTLSGAPRSAFEKFPMPRNTGVFAPTFSGEGVVRSDDITKDPRYGKMAPHYGQPKGHLPVHSYLAAPVMSRSGEVIGGLFFGHAETGVFDALSEERIVGLASQAAVAMDNARLFRTAQSELRNRAAAEAALQELNANLEHRVATEVAERAKAEEALRQAQKMEAIGQLTGGVAHDFNNLLTVIIGGLDTLRRSKPGEEARMRRAVDMAAQAADRAASLTGRLLAFSRRQPLAPAPADLNLLVRDMTELLHRTLGEQIELEGVLAPRLWQVEVDQNQLENAILNLAVNARDAMPEGGKLTIETQNTALDDSYVAQDAEVIPGQYVCIAVSDTGHGMAPETIERAFEPFFTTKEVGRGTGLGLSMVYGFVKQSGGHITIYSEPEHGTTVKLYFPRYLGDALAARDTEQTVVPLGSEGEVVLVVEDNEDVRAYSVMILTELGYQVREAADADAALRILETAQRIDLLFTDVVLPGKSGRMLADAAMALRPQLKVLFTTGYSRNAIVHHGRLDPGVQLISKPFTLDQLAVRVRDILDRATV